MYKTISKKNTICTFLNLIKVAGCHFLKQNEKKTSPKNVTVPRSGMAVAFMMLKKGVRMAVAAEMTLRTKNTNLQIRGGNPSNFWIGCGFGFLQKSVKKNLGFSTDFGFLEFYGLRIFGFGLLILAIILYVFFKIKNLY